MNVKKRLVSVVIIVALLVAVCMAGWSLSFFNKANDNILKDFHKETIHLWYTDDALTDYLNSKAVAFYEENDIRIETKLVSGLEYLEEINKASIAGDSVPDVYIVSNDSLEKAYLAGLATEISDSDFVADETGFSQAARDAVTYHGKYIAYPMYYETAALLYNKTYLEQIAQESEVEQNDSLIPSSIADILTYADQYSAPENVEYFFRWDVSDIFYNYFFIGNYITVGGAAGDNKDQIDIYNTDAIASLKVYQELNQFFSIDTKETSYDSIMQEFIEGKTIYTIATSDCLDKIEEAKKNGEFAYEYGIAKLPNINQDLITKGMSVTNALVVNGYSTHKEAANSFVKYLSGEASSDLYAATGKLPARNQDVYENENLEAFAQNYAVSFPIPKMVETSNFWVELEICFAKVWDGADANTELKALGEQIKTQIIGETFSLERLDDPQVELLPAVEYEDTGESE